MLIRAILTFAILYFTSGASAAEALRCEYVFTNSSRLLYKLADNLPGVYLAKAAFGEKEKLRQDEFISQLSIQLTLQGIQKVLTDPKSSWYLSKKAQFKNILTKERVAWGMDLISAIATVKSGLVPFSLPHFRQLKINPSDIELIQIYGINSQQGQAIIKKYYLAIDKNISYKALNSSFMLLSFIINIYLMDEIIEDAKARASEQAYKNFLTELQRTLEQPSLSKEDILFKTMLDTLVQEKKEALTKSDIVTLCSVLHAPSYCN